MEIKKLNQTQYLIFHQNDKLVISRAKFEDLYYAVPLNDNAFLRLLQDEICTSREERLILNQMLQNSGDKLKTLAQLQQQIQTLGL